PKRRDRFVAENRRAIIDNQRHRERWAIHDRYRQRQKGGCKPGFRPFSALTRSFRLNHSLRGDYRLDFGDDSLVFCPESLWYCSSHCSICCAAAAWPLERATSIAF